MRQFRPPLDATCIEVPAGLVDAGESASAAALRELKEETGYVGALAGETAISYADPGVCNANSCFVYVEVDGDAPGNRSPKPELEESEAITTFSLPFDGLASHLERLIKAEPRLAVDARCTLAVGLGMAAPAPRLLRHPGRRCAARAGRLPPLHLRAAPAALAPARVRRRARLVIAASSTSPGRLQPRIVL